jgi:hypothetical protein
MVVKQTNTDFIVARTRPKIQVDQRDISMVGSFENK